MAVLHVDTSSVQIKSVQLKKKPNFGSAKVEFLYSYMPLFMPSKKNSS